MSSSTNFIDHRESKRQQLTEYLEVSDHATNKVIGQLADISLQGVKLISHEHLTTGKDFELKVKVPSDIIKEGSISFDAKSIWIGKSQSPDHFAIGFRTTSISDNNRKLLTKLINSAEPGEGAAQ
jgi:hypothetical protein